MVGRARAAVLAAGALLLVVRAPPGHAAGLVSVDIVDLPRAQEKWGYAPTTRRIQPGTWITWSNAGQDAHTVTALDESFDSDTLNPSEGFSWFFAESGTLPYASKLHPWMQGTIIVGEGVGPAAPPPDPDGAEATTGDQP